MDYMVMSLTNPHTIRGRPTLKDVERGFRRFLYSYFEKGCRKKCTRQSREVLWVVLRSLFFIEILKEWYERPWTMFLSAKAKQQK